MDAGDRRGSTQSGPQDVCVSFYADSDEVADRGRLVQLDITLRYQATRASRLTPDGARMELDAESLLEGKASQLACAWDLEGGAVRYELERVDGDEPRAFPATYEGTARLSGFRETEADGATVREEVDMTGPLEALVLRDVGVRENADSEVCVILSFDAPLRGTSLQRFTAPGIQREEPMDPSALVLDGYSALSPETYDGGDHRFLDQSFSICTGEEPTDIAQFSGPRGLSISPDGRVWQRSGVWQRHPSGPAEQRTLDFRMRVVAPTLPLD